MKPAPILISLSAALALTLSAAAAMATGENWPTLPHAPWLIPSAQQVRVEQHFSIRITPGASSHAEQMQMDFDSEDAPPRFTEHKMGKCLNISAISSVQGGSENRLLLQLRNQHLISATLEKSCLARDFYSGFYLDRNTDGQICVGRDQLRSRNGVSCKIKRLHELQPVTSRRFK